MRSTQYFTLLVLEEEDWAIAFGHWSRVAVESEAQDTYADNTTLHHRHLFQPNRHRGRRRRTQWPGLSVVTDLGITVNST